MRNFSDIINRHDKAHAIAQRVSRMSSDRARVQWNAAFDGIWADNSFYHLAHNWQSLPTITPAQRRACKLVLHLERKSCEPFRLSDALYTRLTA